MEVLERRCVSACSFCASAARAACSHREIDGNAPCAWRTLEVEAIRNVGFVVDACKQAPHEEAASLLHLHVRCMRLHASNNCLNALILYGAQHILRVVVDEVGKGTDSCVLHFSR